MTRMSTFAPVLLLAALAIGPAWSQAPPPTMRVEEPGDLSHPPIDPDQDSRRWQAGKSALSPKERAALEERRRQVESMALHVREARLALEQAGGKEREDRARALEQLILDRAADDAHKLEQLDKLLEKTAEAKEKRIQKSLERQEQKAGQVEKNLEKQVERKEKQLKEKEKQLEKDLEKQIEKQEKEQEMQDKAREKHEKEKTGKPGKG